MFGSCCPIADDRVLQPGLVRHRLELRHRAPAPCQKMVDDGCEAPAVVIIDVPVADFAESVAARRLSSTTASTRATSKYVKIPLDRRRTTAPRSPRRSTAPTASTAASSDQNWASFLPAMAVARRHAAPVRPPGQPQRPDRRAVPGADPGRHLGQRLPEHRRPDVGRLPRRARGVRRAGPRLEQPRRPRHVGGVRGVRRDRPGHGRRDQPTTRSSRPPTRRRRVDTGGMVAVLDLSTPWDGMGGAFPRIFNRTVTFDQIDDGVLDADRRSRRRT